MADPSLPPTYRLCADGVGDGRPVLVADVKGDVHAGERGEDVAEQDDAVGAESLPWL